MKGGGILVLQNLLPSIYELIIVSKIANTQPEFVYEKQVRLDNLV